MNLRNATGYTIGLDIGTGSVGWAVLDEQGELFHFKGKPAWGSRLFPSADSASTARFPRGQRRRYDRRRQRLDLLQELFCEEMESVDAEFFNRLRQSRLLPEDREEACRDYHWPLFNGSDFTEKDYYKRFPTIYHLRVWLMETKEVADLRLVYLAFHHIVKTRGNFLHQDTPGLSAKNANMKDSLERFCQAVEVWCEERELVGDCKPSQMRAVLEDGSLKRSEKRERLIPLLGFNVAERARAKELAGALLGFVADFGKVFGIEGEGLKFSLRNDEAVDEFYASCPDEDVELYEAMQAVYSSYVLFGILKGADGRTISYCKVEEYRRYGEDLALLKALVREYAPGEYQRFFRGPHYADARWGKDYDPAKAYGYTRYNLGPDKKGSGAKPYSYDAFAKDVKKLFADTSAEADERYRYMIRSFEDGVFLRRLRTSDNGSIPYQLHLEEMRTIIQNQGRYHPFLLERQKELESLVSFRIPYYVGPLTLKNARRKGDNAKGETRFAWSERLPGHEAERILPWNWDTIIDKDRSAENFIRRMTGTCTYLQGEPVLPRCSLLYEKFCVLNELNGASWTDDGDKYYRFCAEDRLGIYEDLFANVSRHGSVSYKNVEDWLVRNGRSPHPHVRGGQGETRFESKLTSLRFFCDVLGVEEISMALTPMVEELILWNTLFEDRDILFEKIRRAYGDRLDSGQIKKICKKRFTGWGRLSRTLLCDLKSNTGNKPMSIMDVLVEGNPAGNHVGSAMVLMEILRDEGLGFSELIEQANRVKSSAAGGLSVEDLPGSPALRRSVNQALRIVDEIAGIAGEAPAHIFVEVTRDEDKRRKGRRAIRRYDNLKQALADLKDEGVNCLRELKGLNPNALDDAVSLYFMQNARCLYCGKPLDINHVLAGDHEYQIDHILPRVYVKDDSFENRALVCSGCNQRKTDALLIDPAIRRSMAGTWRALRDVGLMGEKKYNNLMRDHVSERQMRGFINRQLVETSQIVKFVQLMLSDRYPDSKVDSVKAGLSHQLREEKAFVKCREANDFHHAHDALLAAELGRFIRLRHGNLYDNPIAATRAMRDFIRSQSEYYKRHHRMPGSASFIVGSFLTSGFDKETGEVFKDTWDAEAECERIRHYLNYQQCYISRMPEVTSGAFWAATIYSPKNTGKSLSLPLKKGLAPSVYGGYSREQYAFFTVYKAAKKGRRLFGFAPIPVYVAASMSSDPTALVEYVRKLAESAGSEFMGLAREKVYKYQLIEVDGERLYITGLKEVRNATEMAFRQDEMGIIGRIASGELVSEEQVDALLSRIVDKYARIGRRLGTQMKVADCLTNAKGVPADVKGGTALSLIAIANASTNAIDLSPFGGPRNTGQMKVTFSSLLNSGRVVFIDQSVTGMFERRQRFEL